MASSRAITITELLIVIVVLLMLAALLFPTVRIGPQAGPKAQAKNDVVQIATAVTAFETEYGRLPGANSGAVGGEVLAMLMGSNTPTNPRKIVFLEVQMAKKGKSGLSNGTFLDPWGGAYQIAYASGTNTHVTAGTNNVEVKKRVAVWNDPRLDKKGLSWFSAKKPKGHYVTSWE